MDTRIFELRTYSAMPGKIDALHARFRDHTLKLFEKHQMTVVGFWKPTDEQQAKRQLVYLLSFPNKEAAAASWKEFQADPEWQECRKRPPRRTDRSSKKSTRSTSTPPTICHSNSRQTSPAAFLIRQSLAALQRMAPRTRFDPIDHKARRVEGSAVLDCRGRKAAVPSI